MTAVFGLPGVLSSVPPGMEEFILLGPGGFPSRGLESMFLFEETSGTDLIDELGGAAGVIDNIQSLNNAFERLSGGGLQLAGAQLASFPAFDGAGPWTLITACRVVNNAGSPGTERIAGLIGNRSFGTAANQRGAVLYQRGATNLSTSHSNAFYEQRPSNGSGGQGGVSGMAPTGLNTFNLPRLAMISYNGTDTITSRIVAPDGLTVASGNMTVSDTQLWSNGTTVASVQQWCVGGVLTTYAGGTVQHECAARYSLSISDFSTTEIALIAQAAAAIGADRGRAWA